ncbi:FAD-dependent oxidoreductase [Lysobacter firmicutimachus]|uniref:FAD-dependent oxidoreductase n=1 Tax=Lysobacter firmicutimachus TaxID=1792846 RepID=A0AAU8N189_9GAMM
MRIAVIGSGIAGLSSAWLLHREHDVALFERDARLGGHTHTHEVRIGAREYRVDTGFIVFNTEHYPLLSRLFAELGVVSRPTTMSFSVQCQRSGLEYNATDLDSLFCQRRNLLSPRFWGMVRDLIRFYRRAPELLQDCGPGPSLGEYLRRERYGAAFRDLHLLPMTCALWSLPVDRALEFPARYLVRFLANHQMLQIAGRPQWRVVDGGSDRYLTAMRSRWNVRERSGCAVLGLRRDADGVWVRHAGGVERFDHVVLACHSDQALALLEDASAEEREVLGAIAYQPNDVVLHTDARLLPRRRKAWAAWNAYVPADPAAGCTVSYCMNLLQGLDAPEPVVVTLNRSADIDPSKVLARMRYEHPVHDPAAVAAQQRKPEIQGRRRTWFAGAYWGWGFHEDGIRSAVEVAQGLGATAGTRFALAPHRDPGPRRDAREAA